jgi:hypothetical protein
MLRVVVIAIFIVSAPISSFAQTQPVSAATPQPAALAAKPTANKPARQPEAAAKSTKRADSGACQIGVIPIAGNLFLVETFGLTTLTDTYARVAVDGWALDELIVSRVRAAVPGMSVRRIPFTKEELAHHRTPISLFDSDANIREFARYASRGANCERYVVVHRNGGSQREFGIGISKHYFAKEASLFAMMYVRVYDGQTFQLIRKAPALMTEDTFVERLLHNPLGGPSRQLDAAMFPDKPAEAATSLVLRDGVRAMLTASLDKTLPALLAQ